MNDDYFTVLGLTPGRYKPRDITRSFQRVRTGLIAQLSQSGASDDARRKLDKLHLAYNALREPDSQAGYLARSDPVDDALELRRLIAASLEDGLLRFSRRKMILEEGRRRGFSGFQTQLLIAQVQFGDDQIAPSAASRGGGVLAGAYRTWPHLVAIGLLAVAIFLILMGWVFG